MLKLDTGHAANQYLSKNSTQKERDELTKKLNKKRDKILKTNDLILKDLIKGGEDGEENE